MDGVICDNIGDLCREEGKFQSLFRKEAERREVVRTHAMDAGFSFVNRGGRPAALANAKPMARLRRASSSEIGSPTCVGTPVPLSASKPKVRGQYDGKEGGEGTAVAGQDDGGQEEQSHEEETKVLGTLAPLLFDLPPQEAERFNRYRLEYQMYRKGQARGAKGEAAASLEDESAHAFEGMTAQAVAGPSSKRQIARRRGTAGERQRRGRKKARSRGTGGAGLRRKSKRHGLEAEAEEARVEAKVARGLSLSAAAMAGVVSAAGLFALGAMALARNRG